MSRPRLLLIDEMSLGLAPIVVEQLLPVLRTIVTDTGAGILVVEQHVPLVLAVAERAYLMRQGRVVFAGAAQERCAIGVTSWKRGTSGAEPPCRLRRRGTVRAMFRHVVLFRWYRRHRRRGQGRDRRRAWATLPGARSPRSGATGSAPTPASTRGTGTTR